MPSTYVNNLRLEEMATGEKSGTWGTITNSNLELVGEALGYGTEALASDADATITMADGASDGIRSLYVKITSGVSLTTTRTITLAPNTVSKVWIIENATSGSQSITISQGSGSNVTIGNGQVAIVYTDGGGASANVVDALTDINIPSLYLAGTQVTSTAAELNILDGVTSTASELNLVDGSVAGTITNSKAVVYGASGEVNATTLQIAGNPITSTAAELNILDGATLDVNELNILDGVTASTAELNYLDITTLGTSAASKAITADADNETVISGAVRGTVTSVSSSSNVTTYDMNTTNNFSTTTTETTDITFSNETAGQSGNILFVNAGHVVSIDADVHISNADLTAINVAGTYLIGYFSPDGTNVYMSATPALVEGS